MGNLKVFAIVLLSNSMNLNKSSPVKIYSFLIVGTVQINK